MNGDSPSSGDSNVAYAPSGERTRQSSRYGSTARVTDNERLADCRVCGHRVATSAFVCPSCGAPRPSDSREWIRRQPQASAAPLFIMLGVALFAMLVVVAMAT